MSFEAIRIAVEGRMAAWNGAPVAFDGVPSSPELQAAIDAKERWVRLTIQHGDSFTASVGANPEVRRTGLVALQIFAPEDRGSRPVALMADSLAAHLEYYRDGPLEMLAASVQRIGPRDLWYQANVTVPFRYG